MVNLCGCACAFDVPAFSGTLLVVDCLREGAGVDLPGGVLVPVDDALACCDVEPMSLLLENILVSLSFTEVPLSSDFGKASAERLPLMGWQFWGFRLGDLVGSSTDLIDEGCDAGGEVSFVFSEALVMIDDVDMLCLEYVERQRRRRQLLPVGLAQVRYVCLVICSCSACSAMRRKEADSTSGGEMGFVPLQRQIGSRNECP